MKTFLSLSLLGLVLGGCSSDEDSITPITLTDANEEELAGTLQIEDLEVVFSARQTNHQVFALELRYADVTFTGELDHESGLFHLDGFVTSTGEDIATDDRDLLVIQELGRALSDADLINSYRPDVENQRGVVYQTAGSALARTLSVWASAGVGVSPELEIRAVHGRTINYQCGWLTGWGMQATHDCWDCDMWDGWSYVNIGPGRSNNCYPDSNGCGKLSCEQSGGGGNGQWQWGTAGDKYGACTIWDSNSYTADCLRHDHCVRNDHDTGSFWCSDDALPAVDDQVSGSDCVMNNGCAGACGGFSSAGQCWCDSGCDGYGDCCMDKHQKCG